QQGHGGLSVPSRTPPPVPLSASGRGPKGGVLRWLMSEQLLNRLALRQDGQGATLRVPELLLRIDAEELVDRDQIAQAEPPQAEEAGTQNGAPSERPGKTRFLMNRHVLPLFPSDSACSRSAGLVGSKGEEALLGSRPSGGAPAPSLL